MKPMTLNEALKAAGLPQKKLEQDDAERVKAHNSAVKKDGREAKSPHKLGKAPAGYKFDDKGLLVLKEDTDEQAQ